VTAAVSALKELKSGSQVAFSDNFPNITKRVEKAINNCTFRDKIALARALDRQILPEEAVICGSPGQQHGPVVDLSEEGGEPQRRPSWEVVDITAEEGYALISGSMTNTGVIDSFIKMEERMESVSTAELVILDTSFWALLTHGATEDDLAAGAINLSALKVAKRELMETVNLVVIVASGGHFSYLHLQNPKGLLDDASTCSIT